MPGLEALSAEDLRAGVNTFRDLLRTHQEELNQLNVYPVPDGDTGTNMALTLESVCVELESARTMAEVCKSLAHGSLMGARGNSGVILSQILRGFADTFQDDDAITRDAFVRALRTAADAAYEAVLRPIEGTILTVARLTAEAAHQTITEHPEARFVDVLQASLDASLDAVEQTPEMLPVLKDAGVVDAGGRGFTLLLSAFLHVADDRPLPEPHVVVTPASVQAHQEHGDDSSLRYEVMYFLDAPDTTIPAFKDAWGAIGDSIVVVGGDGIWNCHVHTNDIGAAVEAGIEAGRPNKIRVTDLIEQVEEEQWVREQTALGAPDTSDEPVTTAVVAVAVGDGLKRLLVSMGVHRIVAGGQSMNPSTAQILEAAEACNSDAVIVLPNNKNIVPVARQVDALTPREVAVVPTTAVVEALAALVAFDPDADVKTNVEAMEESIGRIKAGEVTQAVRDAQSDVGPVKTGDWIAITRDGIRAVEASPLDAVKRLLDEIVDDDAEIVTIVMGTDARTADKTALREYLELAHSHLEVEVHEGDQPLYPYLIGVE